MDNYNQSNLNMVLEDEPPGWKVPKELLGKSKGQVRVAWELMMWLDQSRKDVQLLMCPEAKGKCDAAKNHIQLEHGMSEQ